MTQPSVRAITTYRNARAAFSEAESDHESLLNFARRIAFDPNKPAGDRMLWCRLLMREGTYDDFTRAQDLLDRIGDYGTSTPPYRPPWLLVAGLTLSILAILAGLALLALLILTAVTEAIK